MKYIALSFLAITFLSCSKTEKTELPFDTFEYSFSAQALDYSIKFNNSDTVYFIKRRPEPAANSYAILDDKQKDSLKALVQKLDFAKYKAAYNDNAIMDASTFTLTKTKGSTENSVHVYGTKAPEELYIYAAKLNQYSKHLDFKPCLGTVK